MIRWNGPVIAMVDFLMSFSIAAVVFMAPPKKEIPIAADKPICAMAIDTTWPYDKNVDIDMWMLGPGTKKPVGYKTAYSKGAVMDLVRDDLGNIYTDDTKNEERICVRFIADGEYIVNLHLYNHRTATMFPIPATIKVSIIDPYTAYMKVLYEKNIEFTKIKEELTVVRFKMQDKELVQGSINFIPIKIRPEDNSSMPSPTTRRG